jgi:XTP/dITP diphosphohydrolase
MKLLIASHNPAKVMEYKRYLSDLSIELTSLSDLGITEEAPEDAETFEENAIKKAKFYQDLTDLPVITDDGGLTIDYLNGAPGVKSRRWLGRRMTDEEMIKSIIDKMKDAPEEKRTCHLIGMVALAMPDGAVHTQLAQIDGIVAEVPTEKRLDGFPYRSFFYLPQFKKFYIDLTEEEHEQVNHRKFAILKLRPHLLKLVEKINQHDI